MGKGKTTMWKKVGIGAAAVIVLLLLLIVTRPGTYHVERSITISATPGVVYAQVTDFQKWDAWSPWAKLDPNMKTTYEGTQGTVGASYAWTGNKDVGSGKMTVMALDPNKRVDIKLDFLTPIESSANNGFKLEAAGSDTKVTWFMDGTNNFMGKAFSLVMDMDSAIGKDFEKGLAAMKTVAETQPAPKAGL